MSTTILILHPDIGLLKNEVLNWLNSNGYIINRQLNIKFTEIETKLIFCQPLKFTLTTVGVDCLEIQTKDTTPLVVPQFSEDFNTMFKDSPTILNYSYTPMYNFVAQHQVNYIFNCDTRNTQTVVNEDMEIS